jgi:transportin-1
MTDQEVAKRSLSGLILKNTIRQFWNRTPDDIRSFVKCECLLAIGDTSPLIRAIVGIIITNIVLQEGVVRWEQLLPKLCEMLDSNDPVLCEVCV